MSSVLDHGPEARIGDAAGERVGQKHEVRVVVSAAKIARTLLCIVACVVITGTSASFVSKYVSPGPEHKLTKLMNRFDINHEPSVPAWYSSCALLASSGLLVLTGIARKQERDRFHLHWVFLGVVFLVLSVDEAAMFHEGINTAMVFANPETEGVFYFPWVIPALLFVALVGFAYVRFLAHIDRRTATLFVTAGMIYVMGAVGMEMCAGPFVERFGELSLPHMICEVCEEALEMLGIVVFIYALLDHFARCVPPIRLAVR